MTEVPFWIGVGIFVLFGAAYALVFLEEKTGLRKSKPVMVAAGVIWALVAMAFHAQGRGPETAERLRAVLVEYAELMLFLLSAMTFVNTMVERGIFEALRTRLASARLSMRKVFWITGAAAFLLSPIVDNLTTALVMGMVVLSTFGNSKKAIAGGLVNVVVAANAGGVFSPFGDITSLMIWQKGVVGFSQFFLLVIPALVNWLVPAAAISLTMPARKSSAPVEKTKVEKGGIFIVCLFLLTIALTVFLDHVLHLPPFLGMMTGFGVLNIYGYYLKGAERRMPSRGTERKNGTSFDIFMILEKVEWDTLLFFYGIMLCVGGIGAVGYLDQMSTFLYAGLGATTANTLVGLLSSIVDNIPLTFAVLSMNPPMDLGQWLLITLTAGVGGSLLSVGSAAGVALMGVGKGNYGFLAHLKWSWAILLGFAASIGVHMLLNRALFTGGI